MNRLERALGILLYLRARKNVTASQLAQKLQVSTRTIYRDVEMLSALGVPVYAELGREGGFRLLEGYFLPPVMFTVGEAISLLLGLNSLQRFRAKPYAQELDTAQQKLLAAVPDTLRETLRRVQEIVGFEEMPVDVFSLERLENGRLNREAADENTVLNIFLRAILERRQLKLTYSSPYRSVEENLTVAPDGMLWDRDHWYLVATRVDKRAEPRLWRADRVLKIRLDAAQSQGRRAFDIKAWRGRQWLAAAMQEWTRQAPVKLTVTREMAERLKQDWYYGQAHYRELDAARVELTFGADKREYVFELVRWLGEGAELLEPREWRDDLRQELCRMANTYS
jgi:predicted DNA-binding transcriptional regulator YafY